MPAVEPIVNEEKLNELLNVGHESAQLDYKRSSDLSSRDAVVELVKDVGAMMIDGGYIVVGADDNGNVVPDLTEAQARLFDDATLRGKFDRYLPRPYEIRSCAHMKDGHHVVVVYVAPHESGFCIFAHDGGRTDGSTAFRKGEVFARHGTASERWQQTDIDRALARRLQAAKDQWERDALHPLLDRIGGGGDAQRLAAGPHEALSWRLDPDTFRSAIIEQLRAQDHVPLRLLLNGLPNEAKQLLDAGDDDDFRRLIDRVASLVALAMEIEDDGLLERALSCLLAIFETDIGDHTDLRRGQDSARAWLDIGLRVYGLGALAVRYRNWAAVRTISMRRSDRWGRLNRSWLRAAVTMANRANLLTRDLGNGQASNESILAHARRLIDERPYLRPDLDAGDEKILDSLCQFDVYAAVAAIDEAAHIDGSVFYTSFGHYHTQRSEPAFVNIVSNDGVRQVMFGRDDDDLALVLRQLDAYAQREGFRYNGWYGFLDRHIVEFLNEHPEPEPAPVG